MRERDDAEDTQSAEDERLAPFIAALRADETVRPEWREHTHRRLREEMRRGPARLWSLHPATAMAAALALMAIGAAGAVGALRIRGIDAPARSARLGEEPTTATISNIDVGVRFAVMAPGVKRVSLVGDFNDWDPSATPLRTEQDGQTWSIVVPLAAGRHTYAFLIDGQVVADPTAPSAVEDDFGSRSSLILVSNSSP